MHSPYQSLEAFRPFHAEPHTAWAYYCTVTAVRTMSSPAIQLKIMRPLSILGYVHSGFGLSPVRRDIDATKRGKADSVQIPRKELVRPYIEYAVKFWKSVRRLWKWNECREGQPNERGT